MKKNIINSIIWIFCNIVLVPIVWGLTADNVTAVIVNFLFGNLKCLDASTLVLFSGLSKVISYGMVVSLVLLLIFEFIVLIIFRKSFKTFSENNTFTIKNFIVVASITLIYVLVY